MEKKKVSLTLLTIDIASEHGRSCPEIHDEEGRRA